MTTHLMVCHSKFREEIPGKGGAEEERARVPKSYPSLCCKSRSHSSLPSVQYLGYFGAGPKADNLCISSTLGAEGKSTYF